MKGTARTRRTYRSSLQGNGGGGPAAIFDARKVIKANITALSFSPDGHTLVSGSENGTIKLWDLPSIRRELAERGLDW